MIGVLVFVDAIASTASSHRLGCRCDVCAAAAGDQEALARVLASLQIQARADARDATRTEVQA